MHDLEDLHTIPAVDRPEQEADRGPAVPLVVDLDGTLIYGNLLVESVIALLKRFPLSMFLLPIWLMRGKAACKAEVARRVALDMAVMPLNQPLVDYLEQQKAQGRWIVLATGAHETLAREIAERFRLFDEVLASDGARNLTGHQKLEILSHRYGATGFDYVGNALDDRPIWSAARLATVVNASPRIVKWAVSNSNVDRVFPRKRPTLAVYARALRLHQWSKNLLLYAPLIAALKFTDLDALIQITIGFIAFGLCASSVYLFNDLLDIEDDRRHPNKRRRPFASGDLPLEQGFVLIPALLVASAALSLFLHWQFGVVLLAYYTMTLAYTFFLKRVEALDVVTLAVLYTTRILAGAAAAQIHLSVWLLTFSIFIFLSLALAKRCAELLLLEKHGRNKSSGRGYLLADLPALQSMGVGSGYAAGVVLALYLSSPQVAVAYTHSYLLWIFVPALVYWVTRIWLKTCRSEMHEDPLVFAARDRLSLGFAVLCGMVLWLAM